MFNFEALEMISAEPAGVGSLICKNFISYGLYIACIVMGATYKNATCNEDLALWNIVFGAAGTFVTSIMIAVQYFTTRGDEAKGLRAVQGIGGLFSFAWFILGQVWTFKTDYNDVEGVCDVDLWRFTFWVLITIYILMAIACCFVVVILSRMKQYR